jgi:hypothetical protein
MPRASLAAEVWRYPIEEEFEIEFEDDLVAD